MTHIPDMEIVRSVNGVPIRLTSERWVHIVENHDDLAGMYHDVLIAAAEPDVVLAGHTGELLAVHYHEPMAMVAVYKEVAAGDGFIITAFRTSRPAQLEHNRKRIWEKKQ